MSDELRELVVRLLEEYDQLARFYTEQHGEQTWDSQVADEVRAALSRGGEKPALSEWQVQKALDDYGLLARAGQVMEITARLNSLLAALAEKPAPDEVAWLIERGGLCLGFCDRNWKWITFTDISALRFSRRSDAIRFIEAMRWQLKLEDVLVTEHMWSGEMKIRTDFHSVNLSTGEKTRSIVGDGERKDEVEEVNMRDFPDKQQPGDAAKEKRQ